MSLATRHQTVWGDAYFYHESANLIADGKGFINPIDWIETHVRIQAAHDPPLDLLYLAGWSIIGTTSIIAAVSMLLRAATIAVTAYAGKEITGPRVGLIVAGLVRIYPNVWAPDGMLLSETMAILTVALTMLFATGSGTVRTSPAPRGWTWSWARDALRSELVLLSCS